MKIDSNRPVATIANARRAETYGRAGGATPGPRTAVVGDTAQVLGVPEEELTPKVRAAFAQLMQEVDRLRGELEEAHKRVVYLEELADQDALVPVVNRRAFVRELSRTMSYVERYGTPHSVLFFDVNGMKQINDTLGHAAGDATLAHVAKVLVEHVRESDLVGRLGGDEFGVLLAQADQSLAQEKAEHLAEAIRTSALLWDGRPIKVTLSYGAHTLSAGDDPHSALSSADKRMYAHKRSAAGA